MVAPLTGGPAAGGAGTHGDGSGPRPSGTPAAGPVGGTERARVRRLPDLAVGDRSALHAVLDAGRVAHLAIADGPVWAGVVSVVEAYGTPRPDPRLRHDLPPAEW
ncbi:hypothetical protein [Micromonospora mirobrigensis]|uniref:Uncharacterized protein n=1 Tax=Micromonospora mirobrigensis TaxID=262898 RepID=A0A1C4UKB3_9ACTN|nr:hypothetical protein [Micromonospora mirobrigensis]SCE72118.1 hypothetical protein GA0070564_101543 [Micromonospora mirobrigensis]